MKSARVELASESDRGQIALLLPSYLAELGDIDDYEYLHLYWSEPQIRFPYLIKSELEVAGFALVRKVEQFEMAEFYVAPQFRRARVGYTAVEELLKAHPGKWEVTVAKANSNGLAFWSEALRPFSGEPPVETEDPTRIAFRLDTRVRTDAID